MHWKDAAWTSLVLLAWTPATLIVGSSLAFGGLFVLTLIDDRVGPLSLVGWLSETRVLAVLFGAVFVAPQAWLSWRTAAPRRSWIVRSVAVGLMLISCGLWLIVLEAFASIDVTPG